MTVYYLPEMPEKVEPTLEWARNEIERRKFEDEAIQFGELLESKANFMRGQRRRAAGLSGAQLRKLLALAEFNEHFEEANRGNTHR